jgi:hypothetical protein
MEVPRALPVGLHLSSNEMTKEIEMKQDIETRNSWVVRESPIPAKTPRGNAVEIYRIVS